MISLRKMAQCLGLPDNFSVIRDFFGYPRRTITNISLRNQLQILNDGKHVSLNIIKVGIDKYTSENHDEIEFAIKTMRDIYSRVGIGVGRIEYYEITTQMAPGREIIDDDCEAEDLTDEYTVDNASCDVFFVLKYEGDTLGRSAVDGPFDKDPGIFEGMTGSVVSLEENNLVTAQILAHEVGHYLGLGHHNNRVDKAGTVIKGDPTRLMWPATAENGTNTKMISAEGKRMRKHGFCHRCI